MNSQQSDSAAQENDQGSLQWTCWSELQSQHSLPSEQKHFMQRVYRSSCNNTCAEIKVINFWK